MTIKRRDGEKYESEWHLHHWNHTWYAIGSITANSEGADTADGEFTNLIQETHPNEGGNLITITFSPDRMSFSGVKRQLTGINAGTTNEFEATVVNVDELGMKPDPIPMGSTWTGTLKSEVTGDQAAPTPMSTTAEVIQRTATGFSIRTETTQPGRGIFVWEFIAVPEGDHFKVSDAILVQKTDAFTQDTGRILINSSAVTLDGNELKLLINRPSRRGTTTQTFELTREE